jgi:exopolysaccharide production protein ExoQ
MPPVIAAMIFAAGILGLFLLDRDKTAQTSRALWIPVLWMLIIASRPVSVWMANREVVATQVNEYIDGNPVDRLVFIVLLIIGLVVLALRGKRVWSLLVRNGPLLLFFAYGALSIAWSVYPDVAFKRWIKAVGDITMIAIVLTDANPSAAFKRFLARTGFLLVPVSVLLIKFYANLGRVYLQYSWQSAWTGVTTNKNELGSLCLICGLGFLWRFLQTLEAKEETGRTGRLLAFGAVLGMVAWLLWMANSVTSSSCFLMAGCLMIAVTLFRFARTPGVMHFFAAAIVSVSIGALFLDLGSGLVETMGRNSTLTGRTSIWQLALSVAGNPVFGTGFDSFWLGERLQRIWNTVWWHPNEAHNGYLELYLNLGWMGIALFAIVLVSGYRNAMAAFRVDAGAGRIRMAFLVSAVVYNFTESAIRQTNPMWFIFLLAAMAVPEAPVAEEAAPVLIDRKQDFLKHKALEPVPQLYAKQR